MSAPKPVLLHDDEHSVPNHPKLTYTHEQGTRRIVDRASGIDARIILNWLRDGELPEALSHESVEACVRYQSELDAAEMLLAWKSCTPMGSIGGAESLTKFRLLPRADRELLARVFTWDRYLERVVTGYDDFPKPCECAAPVLPDHSRGMHGMVKCTSCHHEWSPGWGDAPKEEWRPSPTYADNLDAIRPPTSS